jgi:hypothetical protein
MLDTCHIVWTFGRPVRHDNLWRLENDPVKKSVINLKNGQADWITIPPDGFGQSRQSDPMTEHSKTRTELHRSGEDD